MSWLVRGLARRARRVLADAVPDRVVLARRFKRIFGRRLDLRNPQTLNEKLHWMMLYCCRRHLVEAVVSVGIVSGADGQSVAFQILEPVPEPATLLLWGTGAAGLGLARWYRRRTRGHEHESSSVS